MTGDTDDPNDQRPAANVARGVAAGERLRERRLALGLSQAALARQAYCSRGLICDLESGRRTSAAMVLTDEVQP